VKALEAAEASSQSALDATKLGYQVGVRINIDVLNSQSALFDTKANAGRVEAAPSQRHTESRRPSGAEQFVGQIS